MWCSTETHRYFAVDAINACSYIEKYLLLSMSSEEQLKEYAPKYQLKQFLKLAIPIFALSAVPQTELTSI